MPFCKVCRVQYDSPMVYENHLCALEHLRRKNAEEEREKQSSAGLLDKFMVLDSVGSGDGKLFYSKVQMVLVSYYLFHTAVT